MNQKIINKLREYLKREPTEQEIANAPSDSTLMRWVQEEELAELRDQLSNL